MQIGLLRVDYPVLRRSAMVGALCAAAVATGCHAPQNRDNAPTVAASAPASPAIDPLAAGVARIDQAVPDAAAVATAPAVGAASTPATNAVPRAGSGAPAAAATPASPFIIRAQVLLARARFSPGVVDGQFGSNFKHAVTAYQTAHNLPISGEVDRATWSALLAEPTAGPSVAGSYTLDANDVNGPYAADVGEDFVKLAALPTGPQFTTTIEAVAERFHMSQALVKELNPGANFGAINQRIIVIDDTHPAFAKGDVARVDISKSAASVRAFDAKDALIAFYPATVGSTERPSPSGTHKVVGVAMHPDYTYDPKKLAWGPRAAGKLVIKPGPNNPVGTAWIELNAPGYGIHGTPDPDNIGKTASHGCVRLTNWDATTLAGGVKPGIVAKFNGQRRGAR